MIGRQLNSLSKEQTNFSKNNHNNKKLIDSSLLSIYLTNNNSDNQASQKLKNETNNKIDELIFENINLLQNSNSKSEQIEQLKNEIIIKNNEIEDLKSLLSNKNNNLPKGKNLYLSDIESNYYIIKNKYDLLNKKTDINDKKHSEEIDIFQKQINHLNRIINEKELAITNLNNENRVLKEKINNISYNFNILEDENKINKKNIEKTKATILEKNSENKKLEIKYDSIINEYKYKEQNYLLEIKNLKNKVYNEENKSDNLYIEVKNQNELNKKLMKENQKIIDENFNLKNKINEMENIIQDYKNFENKLIEEREKVKDEIDFIKQFKINEEKERKILLKEKENLEILNHQLLKEKNSLLSDLHNKDLIIRRYENDIDNIDKNIEEIKNKFKAIDNISYLTNGFQLYLSQRINKKINRTENIFLYLESSSMEIENLVNIIKIQEEDKNRKKKDFLNIKTEIEHYQRNENKLKTVYSYEQKENFDLRYNLDKINNLLCNEKENNDKCKEIINRNEYMISEACTKNEYLEKILSIYLVCINFFEEIFYYLEKFFENKTIFLLLKQYFGELNKFSYFQNNISYEKKNLEIENNKKGLFNFMNDIKEKLLNSQVTNNLLT